MATSPLTLPPPAVNESGSGSDPSAALRTVRLYIWAALTVEFMQDGVDLASLTKTQHKHFNSMHSDVYERLHEVIFDLATVDDVRFSSIGQLMFEVFDCGSPETQQQMIDDICAGLEQLATSEPKLISVCIDTANKFSTLMQFHAVAAEHSVMLAAE